VSNYAYNPITGQLDLVGGGASYIDGVVDNSSLLPVTVGTPALDSVFLAKAGSGLWLISRRPAGLYVRVANNGVAADWTYLGAFPEVNADANWELYNSTDPTKELKFDLSGLPTATIRTVTGPAGNGQMMVSGQAGSFTTLTANNGTLTASAPVLDLGQTWNASGTTFTGLSLSLTNTASASASAYLSLALDGAQAFSIRRGETNANATIITCGGAGGLTWTARTRTGAGVGVNFSGVVGVGSSLQFGTGTSTTAGDITISREAANILAQSNGTNPQTFNIYNTFTSATNHERGFLKWSSNVFQIGTEKGSGGGTARALEFQTDGTTRFSIAATAAVLNVGGGSFDAVIGRPNAGVIGFARADGATTYIAAMGFDGTTRALVANSGAFIGWSSANASSVAGGDTRLWRDAAGVVAQRNGATGQAFRIYNTDGTDFERLNLRWASNEFVIDVEKGGTGTLRGLKIGSATSSLLGFYGTTPVDQPATVADPSGVTTDEDVEARTAINAIIDRLQELGLIA
jgi:hypothetical protein